MMIVQVRPTMLGIRVRELDRDQVQLSKAERAQLERAAVLMDRIRDAVKDHAGDEAGDDQLLLDLAIGAEAARTLAELGYYVIDPVAAAAGKGGGA